MNGFYKSTCTMLKILQLLQIIRDFLYLFMFDVKRNFIFTLNLVVMGLEVFTAKKHFY